MILRNKATRIRLSDFSSAPMRVFHMTWLAFFCVSSDGSASRL
jgi:hypothetical protein